MKDATDMKSYIRICAVLFVLGLGGLLFALSVLPDQVPMHWSATGVMDRMGSKYELLLISVFGPVISAVLLWAGTKYGKAPLERKILGWVAVFEQLLFWGITFFAIWEGYQYLQSGQDPVSMNADKVLKGSGVVVGLTILVLGNIMPKARRNQVFGVRLPWTLDNDAVWQRSQRFGGFCGVVCGAAILVCTVFLSGTGSVLVAILFATVWAVLTIAMSWKYHKEEERKQRK